MTISEYLIKEHGFQKTSRNEEDETKWQSSAFFGVDCILRIHEAHYLFWSDKLKYFTLAYKYVTPKGLIGGFKGEKKIFNTIMVPKCIYTTKDADNFLNAML